MTLYAGTTWTLEAALGQSPFTASPSWTDISAYVRNDPQVSIFRGRSTELDDVQPGSMTFQLDNRTRTFDPTYGPANIEFTGASTNYWSMGDKAAFAGATTLDVRAALIADDWTPSARIAIAAQYAGAANLAWIFWLDTDGTLGAAMSSNGTSATATSSTVKVCGVDGQLMCVRMKWQSSDGATRFYVKRTTPARCVADCQAEAGWVQVGPTATGLTAALFDSAHPVVVGANSTGGNPWDGKIFFCSMLTDDTEQFALNAKDAPSASSTSFTSSSPQGETWSKTGSASVITTQGAYYGLLLPQTRIRFSATYSAVTYRLFDGFVEQWPQAYNGPTDSVVTVTAVDAFGIFANTKAPDTPLAQAVAQDTNVVAYWPLREASTSTGLEERVAGLVGHYIAAPTIGDSLNPTVAVAPSKTFAGATTTSERATATGTLDTVHGIDAVCFALYVPATAAEFAVTVSGTLGATNTALTVWQNASTLTVQRENTGGSGDQYFQMPALGPGLYFIEGYYGVPAQYTVGVYVNGASPGWNYTDSGRTSSATFLGYPNLFVSGYAAVGGCSISDVIAQSKSPTGYLSRDGELYRAWVTGRALDLSGTRVGWLLDSVGWPSAQRTVTTDASCYLSAAGGEGTVLSQLKAINDAEQGRLYMGTDGKVIFRSRVWQRTATVATVSQATFGDSGSEIRYSDIGIEAQSLQYVRNQCSVGTSTGGTATYEDQDSIDLYGVRPDSLSSVPVTLRAARNLAVDRVTRWAQPLDRVPAVTVEMLSTEGAGVATTIPAVLALDFGSRVTVNRRPQSVGTTITGAFTVEGIQHTIGSGMWKTTLNLAPAPQTATEAGHLTADDAFLGVVDSGVVVPY